MPFSMVVSPIGQWFAHGFANLYLWFGNYSAPDAV